MGVFHVFLIVQMVPTCSKHQIFFRVFETCHMSIKSFNNLLASLHQYTEESTHYKSRLTVPDGAVQSIIRLDAVLTTLS